MKKKIFEKTNKIGETLGRIIKKKKKETSLITNSKNEKRAFTTDPKVIKKTI